MQRVVPRSGEKRANHGDRSRRIGSAAAALLVVAAGLGSATLATSADAATHKKKPAVMVSKVAGVPKSTTAGSGFKVKTTVRNATKKPAKASVVFRLSRDKKVTGKDTRLAIAKTGKLRPRATKRITTSFKLPKVLADGTYYVFACAGSSCKSAKTVVLRSDSPPPSSSDRGTVTGTLSFSRAALAGWSTVRDEAKVDVNMNYKGPFAVSNDLVSTGSSLTYDLNRAKSTTSSEGCVESTTDTSKGTKALVVTGDRYTDEINGDVVYTDYSEINVNLNLTYPFSTKVVKSGPAPCQQGTTDSAHTGSDLLTVRLSMVSRNGSDVTYQVKSVTGDNGGASSWTTVTGTLTLHLG